MKKINLLLSTILISSPLIAFDANALKENLQNIGIEIYENISRQEKETETFEICGEKIHSSKELIDLGVGRIEYNLYSQGKEIYLSVNPKKEKDEKTKYNDHFTILEGTDLFIAFPNNNEILEYSSQAEFIKQNFFQEEQIEKTKKGLLDLKNHEEAKRIIESGKSSLENLISIFGKKIQESFESFIEESEKKYVERIRKELKVPENYYLERIPLGIPDKLVGQKLSSLEYKINFKEKPKNFSIYSILNLNEREEKLLKKIETNLD